nr:MFS transporter [uncultured Clostridium sp.]
MSNLKDIENPNKIGAAKFLAWSISGAPVAIQAVLLGFLTVYCTNALGLNAALVGTILFASKVFDGGTDLMAGYIVDRTNTKLGRGRPYEFAIIGIWLMTWMLFSVPTQFSTVTKYIWIFVCYTMAQAIFLTLKNAAGNVYMVRAFNNTQKYIKLSSLGGLLSVTIVIVFNVMFPMFYAKVIDNAAGWSRLILYLAIPMAIIGMIRFFVVKEEYNVDVEITEKITLKNVMVILKTNKIFIQSLF